MTLLKRKVYEQIWHEIFSRVMKRAIDSSAKVIPKVCTLSLQFVIRLACLVIAFQVVRKYRISLH